MRRRLVRLCHKVLPNPKSNATQVPSDATATTSGVRNEDAEASFDIAPLGSEVQHEDLEERSDSAFRHTESAILSTTTSIDSLPVELLSKIFRIHLLDDLRRRRFRNHMVAFERVIPLVCKFWRAVAYAEPWLWTIYDAPKPEYLPALMDRYIPRTGDCPLHLRCWSNERLPNFLQAMSPYASRWATLGIRATYRTLEELMPLATPLLDQVQIQVEWLHEDDQHLSLHFLRGAPRLRNLTLVDYGEALFSFSLPPLPNLTHLVLQLEDYDVSNLSGALGGCRATLIALDLLIYDAQVASIPLDTPSTFPALQKLTLRKDSGRLLDIVSAPVIEYLAVDVIPRESIEALFHFLRRSPTTAKYLQRLRVGKYGNRSIFLKCLVVASNLIQLELKKQAHTEILRALLVYEHRSILLPKLRKVILHGGVASLYALYELCIYRRLYPVSHDDGTYAMCCLLGVNVAESLYKLHYVPDQHPRETVSRGDN